MNRDFIIEKYSSSNQDEYNKLRYKFPKEFYILNRQDFKHNKSIFILKHKTIFNFYKILGYAIICDHSNEPITDKEMFAFALQVDTEQFVKHKGVVINDFMISHRYKRQGIGTMFFKYIKSNYYNGVDMLLFADEEGIYFWGTVGFTYINENMKTMFLKG